MPEIQNYTLNQWDSGNSYIDQDFYEILLGVDIVADDTKPDFQRACVKASTIINSYCGNRIDNLGFEHLSDRQQFLVKKATAFYVQHFLNSGELDAQSGTSAFSGGGLNYTFTAPMKGQETVFIPGMVLMLLQEAGLLTQIYGFDPIKEQRRAKREQPQQPEYRR